MTAKRPVGQTPSRLRCECTRFPVQPWPLLAAEGMSALADFPHDQREEQQARIFGRPLGGLF